jgi:hypothetical protein
MLAGGVAAAGAAAALAGSGFGDDAHAEATTTIAAAQQRPHDVMSASADEATPTRRASKPAPGSRVEGRIFVLCVGAT